MDAESRLRLVYVSIGADDGLIITHGELEEILNREGVEYEN
jgi:hypothetical protein